MLQRKSPSGKSPVSTGHYLVSVPGFINACVPVYLSRQFSVSLRVGLQTASGV